MKKTYKTTNNDLIELDEKEYLNYPKNARLIEIVIDESKKTIKEKNEQVIKNGNMVSKR